jgi:hypothetical protein
MLRFHGREGALFGKEQNRHKQNQIDLLSKSMHLVKCAMIFEPYPCSDVPYSLVIVNTHVFSHVEKRPRK